MAKCTKMHQNAQNAQKPPISMPNAPKNHRFPCQNAPKTPISMPKCTNFMAKMHHFQGKKQWSKCTIFRQIYGQNAPFFQGKCTNFMAKMHQKNGPNPWPKCTKNGPDPWPKCTIFGKMHQSNGKMHQSRQNAPI